MHPYYEDFSTPCFDGLHHVIMGGSFISTGNEASIFSRFHFRPHFFQHASFRLVEQEPEKFLSSDTDAPGPFVGNYPFRRSAAGAVRAADDVASKKDRYTSMMSKNYGQVSSAFAIPEEFSSASKRVNDIVLSAASNVGIDISVSNILDVGCGQGGESAFCLRPYDLFKDSGSTNKLFQSILLSVFHLSLGLSFLLAPQCRFVIGIDHNHEDVETARQLLDKQTMTYFLRSEGDLKNNKSVFIEGSLSSPETQSPKVEFRCADPMCLPAELSAFDIVVLNDVIDKVSAPGSVLSRLGGARGMVRQGGLLIILSAFEWKDTITPRSLWLGGNGDILSSETGVEESPSDALSKRLSSDFECVGCEQVPLFWQETSRDLKGKLYHVTQWKRL